MMVDFCGKMAEKACRKPGTRLGKAQEWREKWKKDKFG